MSIYEEEEEKSTHEGFVNCIGTIRNSFPVYAPPSWSVTEENTNRLVNSVSIVLVYISQIIKSLLC